MHALVFGPTTRGALGRSDYIVASWGTHGAASSAAWPVVLRWWRRQMSAGVALPKLIHREGAPTHWPGEQTRWQHSTRTCAKRARSCRPPPLPRDVFARALEHAGLAVDDVRIAVLPIGEATRARSDEHGLFHYWSGPRLARASYVRKQGGWYLADCVHFCIQSSTLRYWSAALLALIDGMAGRTALPRK